MKVFKKPAPRRAKIVAMLANPPHDSFTPGHDSIAWPLDQVLDDRPRLRQHQPVVHHHRRLPERVDVPQRPGRELRLGVALVVLDLVGLLQLFEEPEDAL